MRRLLILLTLLTMLWPTGIAVASESSQQLSKAGIQPSASEQGQSVSEKQQSEFDHRLSVFNQSTGNKKRAEAANLFFDLLASENFADKTAFDSNSHPDTVNMNVWYYAAEYLYGQQRYSEAIVLARRALPLTKGNHDFTWQSETLNILALSTFNLSDWTSALDYARQMLATDQKNGDNDRIASTLNTIADIYLAARQPAEAEIFITKAEEVCRKTGNSNRLAVICGIASETHQQLGNYDKALSYAREALALTRENGREDKSAVHLSQMAAVWLSTGKIHEARKALEEAIPTLRQAGNRKSLGISMNQLGEVNRLEGHLGEAVTAFNHARELFAALGDTYNEARSLQGLYSVLYQNNPAAAKVYHDRYIQLRDSLYDSSMQNILSSFNAQYRNEELQREKDEVHHRFQLARTWGIVAAMTLLLSLILLLYAYRQKNKTNRFLKDLQRIRDTILTHVTHELRTPLTLILGISQKAQQSTASDLQRIHEEASLAEKACHELMQLTDQMVDIARSGTSNEQQNWVRGNVVPLFSMLADRHRQDADEKGIELRYSPPVEREIEMDTVPNYLEKIVDNLMTDALRHTPQYGHIYLSVHTANQKKNDEAGKHMLVITVSDTGCGIKAVDLPHIFEPFYESKDGMEHGDTSLHLLMVKQLSESLGGQIMLESIEGKGTTATVMLPLQSRYSTATADLSTNMKERRIPEAIALPQLDNREESNSERPRILIVEDNHDMAYYTGSLLTANYDLLYASNGRLALEKAENLIPDLIITDVMMPEMNGLELTRRVRQQEAICQTPIIIISARCSERDRIAGLEAGADAYMNKPFSSEELNIRVRKLLEQRQMLHLKYTSPVVKSSNPTNTISKADSQFVGRVNDLVYSLMKHGNVDINTVAGHLFMSPSQFRRKFTAITGETPASYIMNIRLSNAQRLIDAHPDWSISEVADRCGFSDSAHFTNAFKRTFGMTPTQYAHRAK